MFENPMLIIIIIAVIVMAMLYFMNQKKSSGDSSDLDSMLFVGPSTPGEDQETRLEQSGVTESQS